MFFCKYEYFSPLICKVQIIRYSDAVKHLDLQTEQLEKDVVLVREDLHHLTEKVLGLTFSQ